MNSERIYSIDIFRGLTIFLMVFVNDLAGVANIPGWMKHMPPGQDGMTFVDVVFPAFLFIVGMAIPFAVENRFSKGTSTFEFWKHVLIRTLGLLILGVYMVNSEEMNSDASLVSHSVWAASLYIASILIWNQYPRTEKTGRKNLFWGLRILGFVVLIVLFFLYRKGEDGDTWMTPSWWGILGLIGWAYLIAVVFYMLSGRGVVLFSIFFVLMVGLLLLLRSGLEIESGIFNWLKGESGHVSHASITMAGILCSLLLRKGREKSAGSVISSILIFGVLLTVVGYFSLPFGGIYKNGASPSWAFYSSAICCGVFPLVYWLVDLKGWKKWAAFLKPAGQNPLLTYILPPLYYAIAGFSLWPDPFNSGFPGFIRSVVFSLLILLLAGWLTRKKIRLHL